MTPATTPLTIRPVVHTDLFTVKGNSLPDKIFYNTKVRVTGNWTRITRHSLMQSKRVAPRERKPRKDRSHLLKYHLTHATPEAYVDYLFTKHRNIYRNKNKRVDRLLDSMRTNVRPKKNKTSFGTIFMRVSFRDQDYPTDRKDAFRKLEYCMKRAESWLGYRLQYHRVLEQGEQTNRWHFHVVIYNAPYASFEQWQENAFIYGTVNVRTVYDVAGLGKYCTKISRYITKGDEVLPRYAKAYAPSLRLKKPIDYYELSDTLPILFQRFKEHALVVQETKWLPNTYYVHDTLKYELWQTGT